MCIYVTITLITSERGPPFRRVGAVIIIVIVGGGRDISRDILTRKKPNGDSISSPLGSIHATTNIIEAFPEVSRIVAQDAAARVFRLVARIGVAVRGIRGARHAGVQNGAAFRGMESHGIRLGAIDAFDDVDFAHSRPIGTDEPESGPNATDTAGHVGDVSEEQALVEGFLAGDADALAAGIGGGVVVDAHVSCVTVVADGAYHFVLHRGCVVDILDEAGGRICFRERREGVEEIVPFVRIGKDIACLAYAEEDRESEKAGESVGLHAGEAAE